MKQLQRFLKRKSVRQILGDNYVLTDRQAQRLLLILDDVRKVKELEDWLPAFAYFVRNDLTNYVGRFRRLKRLPASPSLYSLVLRYGKHEALQRLETSNQKRIMNFPASSLYWSSRGFSQEEANQRAKGVRMEGTNKAIQVLRGSSEYTARSLTFWIKQGYSLDEATLKVRHIQTTNGIAAYRQRGLDDPERAQRERTQKWLATLSSKDSDEQRRIKLAKTHTIEGCLARGLTLEEAETTLTAYFSRRNSHSTISQTCFDMVRDRLGESGLYYKMLNYEKQFNGKNVDFYDSHSRTVIEFLGDFWHANPITYGNQDYIYGRMACHVRLDDQIRFTRIKEHPFVRDLYVVWESEFRKNPTEVVQSIVQALLEDRA